MQYTVVFDVSSLIRFTKRLSLIINNYIRMCDRIIISTLSEADQTIILRSVISEMRALACYSLLFSHVLVLVQILLDEKAF